MAAEGETRQIVVRDPTRIAFGGKAYLRLAQRLDLRCEHPLRPVACTIASISGRTQFRAGGVLARCRASDRFAGLRRLRRRGSVNVPWSAETARAIGADWLEAALAPAAEFGRRARRDERAFVTGDEAAAREALAAVFRAAAALPGEAVGEPAPRDRRSAGSRPVAGARRRGRRPRRPRVLRAAALPGCARARARVGAGRGNALPSLPANRSTISPQRSRRAVRPARTFYLADDFDAELARARGEAAAARAAFDGARSILEGTGRHALGVDYACARASSS